MTGVEATVILAWAAAASAAVGAYSAYQGGQTAKANARSQQDADKYNATIASQNAAVARQQASAREEAQRRQARQVLGEQRAALSQAGIGLAGSAADVYGASANAAELDALNIRYEGELDARGLLAQSSLSSFEGQVAGRNARTASQAGGLNAASSLLAGDARTPKPPGGG
jgi:hypothetical protein